MPKKNPIHQGASDIIRAFFGGSDRPHHLKMSRLCVMPSAIAGYHWGSIHSPTAGIVTAIVAAYACLHQERWASADRDVEESKRRPCSYWLPYGRRVRHRSWASHGLVVGTVIRLLYGYWGAPFWLGAIALWLGSFWLLAIAAAWITGALVNDIGHLILDI